MNRILLSYSQFLHTHRYTSQSMTAAFLWFTGDMISQKITMKPQDSLDLKRLSVMTAFGAFFAGPLYTIWYRLLDDRVVVLLSKWKRGFSNLSNEKKVWNVTLAKVAADMILFDPPFITLFFTSTTLMSGNSTKDVSDKLALDFSHTYLIDIALWTPIQLFNFRYVPLLYQPVLVNLVNTGWNSYLSFVSNKAH